MGYLVLCLMAFAFNIYTVPSTNQVIEFLENNANWVKDCQDNRVYLKTEHLTVGKNAIHITDEENNQIPLTELFSDSQGVYTRIESLGAPVATVYPIVWCRNCNAYRTVDIRGLCVKCGTRP